MRAAHNKCEMFKPSKNIFYKQENMMPCGLYIKLNYSKLIFLVN